MSQGAWFDYTHQAWVVDGRYVTCGHPPTMACGCYGRAHAGEAAPEQENTAEQLGEGQ
jgi:hypothetical protein